MGNFDSYLLLDREKGIGCVQLPIKNKRPGNFPGLFYKKVCSNLNL